MLATPRVPSPKGGQIQIIIKTVGSRKKYLEGMRIGDISYPEDAGLCTFCPIKHPLRRHGFYKRRAVTQGEVLIVLVLRLICPETGRTVSLLPDFLIPRKQHSCGVISCFFHAWAVLSLAFGAAMERATTSYPSRQKGQYWVSCFMTNIAGIGAYLASVFPRQDIPARRSSPREAVSPLISLIFRGFNSGQAAMETHSRRFHSRFSRALM